VGTGTRAGTPADGAGDEVAGGHVGPATPSRTGSHFAGFDGLRAVAALGVLVTHVALASGMSARRTPGGPPARSDWLGVEWAPYLDRADIGVALFFALSGFLLYRPFVAARMDGRSASSVGRYLWRRFLRIFPAYWAALLVLAVVLDVRRLNPPLPPQPTFDGGLVTLAAFEAPIDSVWNAVRYFGLLQSFSNDTSLGGLRQAWTLTNELCFYLLLPLWAAGAAWLARRLAPVRALQAELVVLGAAAAGALGFRWWLHGFQVNDPTTGSFDVRFHWIVANFNMFVPGMALALGYEWSRRREAPLRSLDVVRRHPVVCWGLAAMGFWAVSTQLGLTALGTANRSDAITKELLYSVVAILLLAPVALSGGMLPRSLRWLGSRVMVTLGLVSYGVYLWHEGVIDVYRDLRGIEDSDGHYDLAGAFPTMLGVTLVASVAIAGLSYLLVERPALSLKNVRLPRRTRRQPEPVPETVT
jgi:peptidoglycan/LPS O-acetylase OafA/YrhL